MSLEKAIFYDKEHRKPYYGNNSKNFDWSCRNHRGCSRCEEDRLHNTNVKLLESLRQLEDFNNESLAQLNRASLP